MYDIEVISGSNYAIISEGSPAYNFLKAMNTKLVMKKLASEPDTPTVLTAAEVAPLCQGFRLQDLKRLRDVGLIDFDLQKFWDPRTSIFERRETYTFTEYGLEVIAFLKEHGGDVEIRLN